MKLGSTSLYDTDIAAEVFDGIAQHTWGQMYADATSNTMDNPAGSFDYDELHEAEQNAGLATLGFITTNMMLANGYGMLLLTSAWKILLSTCFNIRTLTSTNSQNQMKTSSMVITTMFMVAPILVKTT